METRYMRAICFRIEASRRHDRKSLWAACIVCDAPKGKAKDFCSSECKHKFKVRTSPGYVRKCLIERDKEVCACCGLDTKQQRADFEAYRAKYRSLQYNGGDLSGLGLSDEEVAFINSAEERALAAWCAERGIAKGEMRRSWWEADHILPVAEGGGLCDLTNYQTLCLRCHKAKTAQQHHRRAYNNRLTPLFQ